jgi:hypothetical protein
MVNRYLVLLKFLENSNSHLIFEFEGKKNCRSYLLKGLSTQNRIARDKYTSLYVISVGGEEKRVYNIDTRFLAKVAASLDLKKLKKL